MEFALFRLLVGLFPAMDHEHIPVHRHVVKHVETYDVMEDELARLESEAADVGTDFQIAQFGVTVALAFLAGLLITEIQSDRIYYTYVIIIVLGFFFGIIHGIKWYRHRGSFASTMATIREREIAPMGQKGEELRPSELQVLPSSDELEGQEDRK